MTTLNELKAKITGPRGEALFDLLTRLTAFKVLHWGGSSSQPSEVDRAATNMDNAHVISSRYKNGQARHALVLDIDHPAWLVKSTTPNHFHLYIDVPGGIPHDDYMALLGSLARCGVIEQGYRNASVERGHSDVRLPWIKKGQT